MSIRFPKSCKTKADKSAHASMIARKRWEKVHADIQNEPIRAIRPIIRLEIQRVNIDPKPIPILIMDDGLHRRRMIIENGTAWDGVYGRKSIVKWFNNLLKSTGV